jgi:hypothetical protein
MRVRLRDAQKHPYRSGNAALTRCLPRERRLWRTGETTAELS